MSGMEAALASGLLKAAGGKLVSLIASEFKSIMGVKKDLSKLHDILQQITRRLSAFQGAETESNPSFTGEKLKDLAYDIVDLLDEVHLEAEKQNLDSDGDKHSVPDCFYAKPKSLMFQCKMAQKIKAINAKMDEIVKQTREINALLQHSPGDQHRPQKNSGATGDLDLLGNTEKSKIPTRDQEKDIIISKLVESNEGDNVKVLSIVGIGGSGKTTLAKHICDHEKIKEHFKDTIFRVYMSREFDVDKLMGKLFEDITKEKSDLHPLSHILNVISNKLNNRKFLIILDDAWQEDRHQWEKFMRQTKCGAPGSRVLLTTRNEKVAVAVDSWHTFHLKSLTERESWSLFLESSGWVEKNLDSEHIQIVKEILKKCGGVPLAIKILGGVLRGKMEISTLRVIRGSNLWEDKGIEDQVFVSLKLSYIHLEDHLKQCFTFCSIFPKGYIINKNNLIDQWIAHGFIVKRMKEEQPEDIGSEYLDSLVKAGFLQDPLEVWSSNTYKMHDLIHDLTRYILQTELLTMVPKNMTTDSSDRCRYLSLTSCSGSEKVDRGLFDKLRALYISEGNPSFDKLSKKSCSTRSVVLDYATYDTFPLFLLKLEHLGYLEIHNVSCTKVPEAISGCWNLQSLHFIHCKGFVILPESIGKLKKLRTLEMKYIADLESLPQSIGDCQVLQSLKLHYCSKLLEIPSSVGRIKTLRELHINGCSSLQQLMSDFIGEFSSLQIINLGGSSKIQTFTCPKLHTLILAFCNELVELPKCIGKFKSLAVLDIAGCTKLHCMPSGIGQLTHLRQLGLFIVGCGGDNARISELKNLDKLSGNMKITNLKYVKNPCDAEEACLKRKNNIQELVLDWSWRETEETVLSDMVQDEGVLNSLEPPSHIKALEVYGYRGSCLPWWMMTKNFSYCEGMVLNQSTPCQFLCLTKLKLEGFPNLKHMRGVVLFPLLKSLYLVRMPNLEELWTTTSGSKILDEEPRAQHCFPALSLVVIRDCKKLSVKPYFPQSLEKLYFCQSNLQLLSPGSFAHQTVGQEPSSSYGMYSVVPRLRVLELIAMEGSSFGWEFLQHFTGLETLWIECCNDLTELAESIRSLTSLQDLHIEECPSLGVLPDWLVELRCLRHLYVRWTPMLTSLPQSIQHLTSLVSLSISGWSNMKQLPDVIRHLTSLEHLNLCSCDALTVLPEWIGQLSALREHYIQYCHALQCLPQSIKHLTSLQYLFIYECHGLAKRYKKEVGPDWHLISHIPRVEVSGPDTLPSWQQPSTIDVSASTSTASDQAAG